jgi:hypothetical protein
MKSTIFKFISKYNYLFLTITTIFFVIGIFFGSVFNFHELKLAPLYHGLNNEIFYFQYLNYNNLHSIQNSIYFTSYDKFAFNNLSIPLFYLQNFLLKLNNNIQFSINLFVIIGFILSTLSSYLIFRLFQSSKIIASTFAILFSFSYFHQYENTVINASWYGLSLFVIYYSITLIKSDILPNNNKFYFSLYAYCFINAFINLQYALIIWFLILLTILIVKFIQKKSTPKILLVLPIIFLLQIYLVYKLNIYYFEITTIPKLSFIDIENSQFKITQLFLPNIHHHLSLFSDISNIYQDNYIFNSDNHIVSLGFLSLFGLFYILSNSIYSSFTKQVNKYSFDATTQAAFSLIVLLILLTTTGSLSAFISYQNSAFYIEWFRASLFINFLCLLVIVEILNYLAQKISYKKFITLLMVVFIFGFYDQSPRHPKSEKLQSIQEYTDIQDIISHINNNKVLTNKKILVLPINNISSNQELARRNLFISNRLYDYVNDYQTIDENILITMSYLDLNQQVDLAKKLNFNYIIINTKNYCNFNPSNIDLNKTKETINFILYELKQVNLNNEIIDLNKNLNYKKNNPSLICYQ